MVEVLLVTADYTSLYKVIIRKSLGAVYIGVWGTPTTPNPPPKIPVFRHYILTTTSTAFGDHDIY